MGIPRQRYFNSADLPARYRDGLVPLVRALNDISTDVVNILVGGITPDNLLGTVKTITWNGMPLTVATGLPRGARPYSVTILQCLQDVTPVTTGNPAWIIDGDGVRLSGILGTMPGTVYAVTLQILGA